MAASIDSFAWIVSSVLAIALAAGIVLLILGRGRRVGMEPYCRKCGYNLSGLASERCPECGRAAMGRNVVMGRRQRRWALLACGLALVLLALAGAGWHLIDSTRCVDWHTYLPTSALVWMGGGEDIRAVKELARRLNGGRTSAQRLLPLVSLALDKHGVRPQGVDTWTWAELLTSLEKAHALTPAEIEQFHEQRVDFKAEFRHRVRASEQFEIFLQLSISGPSDDPTAICSIEHGVVRIAGRVEREDFGLSPLAPSGIGIRRHLDLSDLAPGRYSVEVQGEKVFTGPAFTRELRLSDELEILAPDAPEPIKLVKDISVGRQLQENLSIDVCGEKVRARFPLKDPANEIVLLTTVKEAVPMNLAFVLFGRVGDREIEMGAIAFGRSAELSWGERSFRRPCADGESFTPILRSSIEAARSHTYFEEIWDGELVLPPIRLEASTGGTATGASGSP